MGTVRASDDDTGDAVTGYVLSGGADQALFSINNSGVLTFQAAPNYEDPQDANTDNAYVVVVQATSGTGDREKTGTQPITVTVMDDDTEAPGAPDAPSVSPASVTSLTVTWSAPDNDGPEITDYDVQYRAGTSAPWSDGSHIGTALTAILTGLLEDTSYQVQVRATNAEGTGGWSASGSGATDANAAPSFTSAATFNAAENQTAAGTVAASDDDTGDAVTGYALNGGADQALFSINNSGVLTFQAAPNYEDPQDANTDNAYLVTVQATSGTGERKKTATQSITVTVTDANEAPAFTSPATFDAAENQTAAGTVAASDDDTGDAVTGYALNGGADQALFSINNSGVLTFQAAPNYEDPQDANTDTAYVVVVQATSGTGEREKTATQTITVTVTDDDSEAPGAPDAPLVSPASVRSLTVNWSAPDNDGPEITDYDVQYRAGTSAPWSDGSHIGTALTAILTGLLEDTEYDVQVRATNAEGTGGWSASGSGATDANAAPSFTSPATFDAAENQTAAGTVAASDDDTGDAVTGYALNGGADQALFSINNSGVLTFQAAPNYEDPQDANTDTAYVVVVQATSGTGEREKTATQTITVTVTDDDSEAPGAPDAPLVSGASVTSLTVNWSAPDNDGPEITDYDVRYRAGTSGDWTPKSHSGTATTATITELEENPADLASHDVQVRATNDEGMGGWSASGSGKTIPLTGGICDRTPRVRDRILVLLKNRYSFKGDCSGVEDTHLAKLKSLDLGRNPSTESAFTMSLRSNDFEGLVNLERLYMRETGLSELPAGVFDGLISLEELELDNNRLLSLPTGVFSGLKALKTLELHRNPSLRSLPYDEFEALPNLTELRVDPEGRRGYQVAGGEGDVTLEVAAAGGTTYQVRLTHTPAYVGTASLPTLTVLSDTGTPGVTASPATLRFTKENWFRRQTVTVSATASAAGKTATLTHTSTGVTYDRPIPKVMVRVLESDQGGTAEPLTAAFEGLPEAHDGETAFTFRIVFSEAVAVTAEAMRTRVLTVTGGAVTGAARVDGEIGVWAIAVTPDSREELSIALAPTADCAADGAVCTSDGRALSSGAAAIVFGPAETNTAATGTPAISGTPQVGEKLTASTSGISDADGLDNASFGYQWIRTDTDIGGATASTYTPVAADEGERLKVRVGFTDDAGNEESLTSAATDAVAAAPEPLPTVSVSNASASEGDAVEFTVSLSAASGRQVTVEYATSGGTAASGTDFTAASGTLTFGANETSKTVSVSTTDDSRDEQDETFTLTLSSPTNATLGDATATGTIVDDDEAPPVAVSVADASATEGDAVEFTVSLSAASGRQVTVEYATSGGTAESGTDFTAASGTVTFAAGETSQTVSVATTDDSADEDDETFTLTLSSPANATLGDATATGTIIDNDDALPPLTASFEGMPASHDGAKPFTFGLTFSEDLEDFSYKTLRDHAFDVAGGEVRGAKRQQQGSNQRWTITVKPSGNGDVTISLPQTTDCEASGAICTGDGRPLSNSPSATVAGPGTSSGSDGDEEDGLLALVEDVTPEAAAAALFGADALTGDQLAALDQLGNRNGAYDLGDLLSWTARCRRNELSCGGTVSATDAGSLPASPAMPPTKRQGRTPPRRRANGHAGRRSGRNRGGSVERVPRQRAMRSGVAGREPGRHGPAVRRVTGWIRALVLGLVVSAWGCGIGEDLVQPVQPDPGPLHVQLMVPPEARDIGAMLVVEGPGIDSLSAPGFELIQADEASSNRRQAIIAGSLSTGPVLQVWVPDRRHLADYRVTLMQVSGDDYGLRDVAEYRAVITSN